MQPNHRLISMDPGLSTSGTAFAFWEGPILIETYLLKLPHVMPWEVRAELIAGSLRNFVTYYKPDCLALESGQYQGKAQEMLRSLITMIQLVAYSLNKPLYPINQATLKAYYGHGSFDKIAVANALHMQLTDQKSKNIIKKLIASELFDETDAAAVGWWAINNRIKIDDQCTNRD